MGRKAAPANNLEKLVLVLSDSELLFNVINANLQVPKLKLLHHKPASNGTAGLPQNGLPASLNPDLIIVASSSPHTEPVVALAEAALNDKVGRTPLLIISDRNFATCREKKIFHLDFPFKAETLRNSVLTLLDRDWM